MKADSGDKIKLTRDIDYTTIHGPVSAKCGEEFSVKERIFSDTGILTNEKIHAYGDFGNHDYNLIVFDEGYEIVNSHERIYTVDEVMENLKRLDDYERTENDSEQDAIKIAKYLLSQVNPNAQFRVDLSKVRII